MLWIAPVAVSVISALIVLVINSNQDQSGAGMVLLFLIPLLVVLNLLFWLIYFATAAVFGIW